MIVRWINNISKTFVVPISLGIPVHAKVVMYNHGWNIQVMCGSAKVYGGNVTQTNMSCNFFLKIAIVTDDFTWKFISYFSCTFRKTIAAGLYNHPYLSWFQSGFQITQYRQPLAVGGYVQYVVQDHSSKHIERKKIHITQLQLEQDSGKSLHDTEDSISLIDLNRAGE